MQSWGSLWVKCRTKCDHSLVLNVVLAAGGGQVHSFSKK